MLQATLVMPAEFRQLPAESKGNRGNQAGSTDVQKVVRAVWTFNWGNKCIGMSDARAHGEILHVPGDLFKDICSLSGFSHLDAGRH